MGRYTIRAVLARSSSGHLFPPRYAPQAIFSFFTYKDQKAWAKWLVPPAFRKRACCLLWAEIAAAPWASRGKQDNHGLEVLQLLQRAGIRDAPAAPGLPSGSRVALISQLADGSRGRAPIRRVGRRRERHARRAARTDPGILPLVLALVGTAPWWAGLALARIGATIGCATGE